MPGKYSSVRNLNRTREKILAAALAEFSAKGFAGARVDSIARRARVNKRMLYYCFGAKQDLYREILRRKIEDRAGFVESMPADFAGVLSHIYLAGGTDIDFVRLMEWEAIDTAGRKCIAEAERRALFEKAIARLRAMQRAGTIPPGINLTQLFISMLSLAMFPLVMPHMIRLITGMEPTDRRFMRERTHFLRWLGELFGGSMPPRINRPARHGANSNAASKRLVAGASPFRRPGRIP